MTDWCGMETSRPSVYQGGRSFPARSSLRHRFVRTRDQSQLFDRIWSIRERMRVIPFGSDHSRQRTARILSRTNKIDDVSKVVSWSPVKVHSRPIVDVDAVDAG